MPSTGVSLVHTHNGRAKQDVVDGRSKQIANNNNNNNDTGTAARMSSAEAYWQKYKPINLSMGVFATISHCLRKRMDKKKGDAEAAEDGRKNDGCIFRKEFYMIYE